MGADIYREKFGGYLIISILWHFETLTSTNDVWWQNMAESITLLWHDLFC
jgi:hypothetical protein